MDTFLTLPAERRHLLCEQAAAYHGLPPAIIKKDFWVCWILRALFGLPGWEEQFTFKGGTSLSKGWQLIARFSEDIDVVISRASLGFGEEIMSRSRWEKLRDTCKPHVQEAIGPAFAQHLQECLPNNITWSLAPASAKRIPSRPHHSFTTRMRFRRLGAISVPW